LGFASTDLVLLNDGVSAVIFCCDSVSTGGANNSVKLRGLVL